MHAERDRRAIGPLIKAAFVEGIRSYPQPGRAAGHAAEMNFVLVPFLLAVRVLPNEDGWINGPEYTFDVRVNTTTHVHRRFHAALGASNNSSLSCKLRCRPEEPDGLICRVDDLEVTRTTPWPIELGTEIDANATRRADEWSFVPRVDRSPFEIRFNDDGVDCYAVVDDGEPSTRRLLNTYRAIANQLSVGVDLRGKGESFLATDSFTVGECPADYAIRRVKVERAEESTTPADDGGEEERRKRRTFALTYLTDLEMRDDETTNITRRRRIADCLLHSHYILGTKHAHGLAPEDTVARIEASDSRMLISKFSFSSVTVNRFGLYDENEEDVGSVREYISLCLECVKPAESKLERLDSATIKTIAADAISWN